MTALEDKLRAAMHATAERIPADPPPLRLSSQRRRPVQRAWSSWIVPLAAAAVVLAVIAASLAVTGSVSRRPPAPQTGLAGVPPYYVALTTPRDHPARSGSATMAQVRATATGAVLATLAVPRPYFFWTGVSGAADDRTFVLVAQEKNSPLSGQDYPARFYLLHIGPEASQVSGTSSGRVSLRALPAGFVPDHDEVHDLALSPDGTLLAANVGPLLETPLVVFNLATGTKRAWSFTTCRGCNPSSGGLDLAGVNVDALSWTADGQHVAFVGPAGSRYGPPAVRLLDINDPGTNLLADSKVLARFSVPPAHWEEMCRAIITPDGRTVLAVEELFDNGPAPVLREQLLRFSAVTGRLTATVNNRTLVNKGVINKGLYDYEQVLYTDLTGNVLVVGDAHADMRVAILHGDTYTAIPWDPQTSTAAW